MKKTLLAFFLFLSWSTFAQNPSVFHIQPIPVNGTGGINDSDVSLDAEVTNLTASTIRLKWERKVISLTPGCETAVCDPNTCWARFVNTKNFDLDGNETGPLLVHFYNNGAPCAGIIHLKVSDRDNPADTTIAVYLFNQTSAGAHQPELPSVQLFPNPVQHYFSLENADQLGLVRLFDLEGHELANYQPNGYNRYSVELLPTGNYILALEDKNGRPFQALTLLKQ